MRRLDDTGWFLRSDSSSDYSPQPPGGEARDHTVASQGCICTLVKYERSSISVDGEFLKHAQTAQAL